MWFIVKNLFDGKVLHLSPCISDNRHTTSTIVCNTDDIKQEIIKTVLVMILCTTCIYIHKINLFMKMLISFRGNQEN